MNVAELIAHLQNLPSDHLVVVEAHQGYADVGLPFTIFLVRQNADVDPEAIGPYAEDFDGDEAVLIAASSPP
ncbi:MAG: hypothetical protein NT113_02715 [Hyphomicrobiales bacterium]|nr:hypothetical protein [Hyphomicrobiales bacterium]